MEVWDVDRCQWTAGLSPDDDVHLRKYWAEMTAIPRVWLTDGCLDWINLWRFHRIGTWIALAASFDFPISTFGGTIYLFVSPWRATLPDAVGRCLLITFAARHNHWRQSHSSVGRRRPVIGSRWRGLLVCLSDRFEWRIIWLADATIARLIISARPASAPQLSPLSLLNRPFSCFSFFFLPALTCTQVYQMLWVGGHVVLGSTALYQVFVGYIELLVFFLIYSVFYRLFTGLNGNPVLPSCTGLAFNRMLLGLAAFYGKDNFGNDWTSLGC